MPAWRATIEGGPTRLTAFAPFRADLGVVSAGQQNLVLNVYGNRINTFGCLHNADARESWFGPQTWFTSDWRWSDEYQLKATGVLSAPRLEGWP
jgi:hypothetical protein